MIPPEFPRTPLPSQHVRWPVGYTSAATTVRLRSLPVNRFPVVSCGHDPAPPGRVKGDTPRMWPTKVPCDWARAQPGARWAVGAVILLTFRFTGLRLHELCTLRLDDLDLGAKRLSVVGKGSKLRTVPIPPVLSPALGAYLEDLRPGLPDSPFVFVNPRGNASRRFSGRFSPRAVEARVDDHETSRSAINRIRAADLTR